MTAPREAIVAGGGIAGACAAAALSARGFQVVVVEPGLAHARRLAGELLHPPAVAALAQLGLAGALDDAQRIEGFAVYVRDAGGAAECVLPYDATAGAAVDHGAFATALLARARALPGVTVLDGARVTGVEHERDAVRVRVTDGAGERTLRAALLVAADGRGSPVRKAAGIAASHVTLSTMAGLLVDTDALPRPRFGHVFTDGTTPVLAYEVAPGRVRVMIDRARRGERDDLGALPAALRADIERAAAAQKPLLASNATVRPNTLFQGRVVLVGDAAGCCHPVSASGIASALADAVSLGAALDDPAVSIPDGLARYAALRSGPHRTRLALASALYRAFAEPSPEMALLRHGLMRYWTRSSDGRAVSMSLLSTAEASMGVMAREYARVVAYAMPLLAEAHHRGRRWQALAGLLGSALPHAGDAVRAALSIPAIKWRSRVVPGPDRA